MSSDEIDFGDPPISPIPFIIDTPPEHSHAASPENSRDEGSSSLSRRPPLREEWETESEVMDSFERISSPSDMEHILSIPPIRDDDPPITRVWNDDDSQHSLQWFQRELRRPSSMFRSGCPSGSSWPSRPSSRSGMATAGSSADSAIAEAGSSTRGVDGIEEGAGSSINDENGERTPEGERMEDEDEERNNSDDDDDYSSQRADQFDSDDETREIEEGAIASSSSTNVEHVDNENRARKRRPSDNLGDNMRALYNASPTVFSNNINSRKGASVGTSKDGENNCKGDTELSQDMVLRQFNSSTLNKQPVPLVLPTKTRLKITIKKWNVTATWKWTAGEDETCGICRMPFEACCIECRTPGDECPLALGSCKHAFHMHCIVKWTETQNTPRPQCPLCRQEWKFAPG